jgi:hypothetical protein
VQHASAQPHARVLVEFSGVGVATASRVADVPVRGAEVPGFLARTKPLRIRPAI